MWNLLLKFVKFIPVISDSCMLFLQDLSNQLLAQVLLLENQTLMVMFFFIILFILVSGSLKH